MKPNYKNKRDCPQKGRKEKPREILDVDPLEYKYCYTVRHTKLSICNLFYTNDPSLITGNKVIVKTSSGLEYGSICNTAVERETTDKNEVIGIIDRLATTSDNNILNHIRTQKETEEQEFCDSRIKGREMKMKLINVEHLFSGEKIIFYFIADGRIDFRELVKDLARRYHTRIEMRQIGVRDEAKMLSDYEHCGRELCCRTFLNELDPVTMRMAKMQKTTLDPNKISGPCGRLMCCLRFEDDIYKCHKAELPKKGDIVTTPENKGKVINCKLLSKEVTFISEENGMVTVPLDEIESVESKAGKSPNRRTTPQDSSTDRKKRENSKTSNENRDKPATPSTDKDINPDNSNQTS